MTPASNASNTIVAVGIDATRPLVTLLAKLVTAIVHADTNNNGKLDPMERIALLTMISMDLFNTFNGFDFKLLGSDIKDLDSREIAELVNVFSMNHSLNDSDLEGLIEDTMKWLSDGVSLVTGFRVWREGKTTLGNTLPSLQRIAALNQLNVAYTGKI